MDLFADKVLQLDEFSERFTGFIDPRGVGSRPTHWYDRRPLGASQGEWMEEMNNRMYERDVRYRDRLRKQARPEWCKIDCHWCTSNRVFAHQGETSAQAPSVWPQVLEALLCLLYGLDKINLDRGSLGELLGQILVVIAGDSIRFDQAPSNMDTETNRTLVYVPALSFLKSISPTCIHPSLDASVQASGVITFVQVRSPRHILQSLTQPQLARMWREGYAAQGAPR